MTLTDYSNRGVLGKVVDCRDEDRRIFTREPDHVVALMAKQSANLVCPVAVVHVENPIPFILAKWRQLANRADAALSRKHSLVFGHINSVFGFQVSLPFNSLSVRHSISLLGLPIKAFLHSYRPFDLAFCRWPLGASDAVRFDIASAKHFAAKFAGMENPSTGTFLERPNNLPLSSLKLSSPFGSVRRMARLASIVDAEWLDAGMRKIRSCLNILANRADMLFGTNARGHRALSREVPWQHANPDIRFAVTASDQSSVLHSSTFGTLASIIKRRIAPDNVVDHAPDNFSSLSRTGLSIRRMMVSVFGIFRSSCIYKSNAATAVCQHKFSQKESGLALRLAA